MTAISACAFNEVTHLFRSRAKDYFASFSLGDEIAKIISQQLQL